jgi:hypothetical protein
MYGAKIVFDLQNDDYFSFFAMGRLSRHYGRRLPRNGNRL